MSSAANLEALLREHSAAGANELRDRIAAAVENFTGEAPQKDDETLVIARVTANL
ncbi:MAG TPA: hypothetical protein VG323_23070 [Thermoanaerobaculia bacterium]|nr:hypothetical protein [Thermoanaerobaculia bacterium]